MHLKDKQKELFLKENIFETLMVKNHPNQNDVKNILNDIHKEFLKQYGIPTNDNMIHFGKGKSYNGKYDVKDRVVYLCPRSIENNNFQYFHTLIHESTHLIQDFVIKNNISRNNIDNLSFEQYKKMSEKYFNNKDIQVTKEMYKNFKNFINQNKYFENENLNIMYKDLIIYSDIAISYNNNLCEIMANDFALRELKNVFFDKKQELNQENINDIKKCIDRDFKKLEKINPETKTFSLAIQTLTNAFKNFSLSSRLFTAGLNNIKPNNKECMQDAQNYLDEAIMEIESVNYYNKEESEISEQMSDLFDTLDNAIPNLETKGLEENNNHDEH